MKHLKNPTRAQKQIMEQAGIPSDRYKIEKDEVKYMWVRSIKNNNILRKINKESGEIEHCIR